MATKSEQELQKKLSDAQAAISSGERSRTAGNTGLLKGTAVDGVIRDMIIRGEITRSEGDKLVDLNYDRDQRALVKKAVGAQIAREERLISAVPEPWVAEAEQREAADVAHRLRPGGGHPAAVGGSYWENTTGKAMSDIERNQALIDAGLNPANYSNPWPDVGWGPGGRSQADINARNTMPFADYLEAFPQQNGGTPNMATTIGGPPETRYRSYLELLNQMRLAGASDDDIRSYAQTIAPSYGFSFSDSDLANSTNTALTTMGDPGISKLITERAATAPPVTRTPQTPVAVNTDVGPPPGTNLMNFAPETGGAGTGGVTGSGDGENIFRLVSSVSRGDPNIRDEGGFRSPPGTPGLAREIINPAFGVSEDLYGLGVFDPRRVYSSMRAQGAPYDPSTGTLAGYQSALERGFSPTYGSYMLSPSLGGEAGAMGSFAEFLQDPERGTPDLKALFGNVAGQVVDPLSVGVGEGAGRFADFFDVRGAAGGAKQVARNLMDAALAARRGGQASIFDTGLSNMMQRRYEMMRATDPTLEGTQSLANYANWLNQSINRGQAVLPPGQSTFYGARGPSISPGFGVPGGPPSPTPMGVPNFGKVPDAYNIDGPAVPTAFNPNAGSMTPFDTAKNWNIYSPGVM